MNDTREEQLLNAGKAADAEKKTDVESLKKKYAAWSNGREPLGRRRSRS